MSRVVKKKKKNPIQIYKHGSKIKSGISDFVSLDRNSLCRASTLNLDRKDFVKTSVEL